MRTLPLTLVSLFALSASPLALANGGGYYEYGGKYNDLVPFEMEDIGAIAMETEDLRVEVGPKESTIHVRYNMRNTENKKVFCRFGFPADLYADLDVFAREPGRYEVKVNGTPLPFKCMKRRGAVKTGSDGLPLVMPELGSPVKTFWMVSELKVASKEAFVLEIRFRVPNLVAKDIGASGGFVSATDEFFYRFSSAAVWNGPIRQGHAEFVPKGVDKECFRPVKPANRFTHRESDGAWVWDFTDLEPTLDDDVTFRLSPERYESESTVVHADDREPSIWSENHVIRYGDNWVRGIDITDWTMGASHTSARKIEHAYRDKTITAPLDVAQLPKRLRYNHHDDVWGTDAPDNGVGQSVTMTFKKPAKLGLLTLSNEWRGHEGYGKVTQVKVVINGKWSKVFDLDGSSHLPLFGSPEAKTVQIVITKAEPGDKFREVILSDLRAWRTLPKKPKINQVR